MNTKKNLEQRIETLEQQVNVLHATLNTLFLLEDGLKVEVDGMKLKKPKPNTDYIGYVHDRMTKQMSQIYTGEYDGK